MSCSSAATVCLRFFPNSISCSHCMVKENGQAWTQESEKEETEECCDAERSERCEEAEGQENR